MNKDLMIGGLLLVLLLFGYAVETQPAILLLALVSILTVGGRTYLARDTRLIAGNATRLLIKRGT